MPLTFLERANAFPLVLKADSSRHWYLIEAKTVRLCGHQHADVVVLLQFSNLALEHDGSFGSNYWVGEAMKLGHEAPALAIQISIRYRHVEGCLSSLTAASLDHDVGISARTAIAVHCYPFANHGERRIKSVLI